MEKRRTRPIGVQMETKLCLCCNNSFICPIWQHRKTCSYKCSNNLPKSRNKGKKASDITRKKMSDIKKGIIPVNVLRGDFKAEKNHKWIKDRTQLKTKGDRRSSAYGDWRRKVCIRDNWKCKINNQDCKDRLEVHHILGFTEYPELRYDINNGITLCQAHHPRKRAEEKRLSPYFMELVSVSKI
jgi:hypothetical protein